MKRNKVYFNLAHIGRYLVQQTGIGHAFDLEHFQVINARIPQIIAAPMHTARAILLKSKKPLPVPVIAQTIAKMVMRTKAILITFRMTPFFMQSHPFIKFQFVWLFHYLYRRKSQQIVPTFLYYTIFLCHFQGMKRCRSCLRLFTAPSFCSSGNVCIIGEFSISLWWKRRSLFHQHLG